jgi:hypothetical protein
MFSLNKTKKFITLTILLSLGVAMLPSITQAAGGISLLDNRVEELDGKTVNIIWKTDSPTKGKVIFGTSAQNMNYYIVDNDNYKAYHEVELANLEPETTYYYQIVMYNSSEQATSYTRSFETDEYNDGLPPQLSNVDVSYVSGNAAFISWDSHEEATSVVEYSIDESYSLRAYNNKRVQEHQMILKNLRVNTLYHVRVYSVDKDGNKSSYHYRTFRTNTNNSEDKEEFKIENFRPATESDVLVGTDQVTVRFNTNHYSRGYISIKRSGFKTQTKEVEYDSTHQVTFDDLSAGVEYKVTCNLVSLFNKYIYEEYTVSTKEQSVSNSNNNSSNVSNPNNNDEDIVVAGISYSYNDNTVSSDSYCNYDVVNSVGYYGKYYNLPHDYKGINSKNNTAKGRATGWYSDNYLSFTQIDSDLKFNKNLFLPIKERVFGQDPFYFTVNWRAILEVPSDMNYQYKIDVDNSGWVYIDGQLVSDMGELLPSQEDSRSIPLSAGFHYLEIFYAERGPGQSSFYYSASPGVVAHPWPVNCNLLPGGGYNNVGASDNSGNSNTGGDDNIIVAGEEFSMYTEATALYKTYDAPDVWAIMNGQRHYISSPASFREYGFSWYDVQTVTRAELEKYPRARLIRSGEDDTIYYLYQRPEGQWLKINITSPTVFVSYPDNYWGNVIDVTQLDIDSYPDVKLITTADSDKIYYLENNERRLVSDEVFVAHGFNQYEVAEVNKTHMESYKIASPLK